MCVRVRVHTDVCVCEREHMSSAIIGMRWLRLVGSLKLKVSFAKELYKRVYILQKRPIILISLLIVATLYQQHLMHVCVYIDVCMRV